MRTLVRPSGGMVDAADSKSAAARRGGSTPPSGTTFLFVRILRHWFSPDLAAFALANLSPSWPERRMRTIALALFTVAFAARPAVSEEVLLAVASNFVTAAEVLAESFEAETGHSAVFSHGSTGTLYAQIVSGAPFDVFLSADAARPALLRDSGLATAVSTYALGRLVLVSGSPIDLENAEAAFEGQRVALADPLVAPYGAAAISVMENLELDTATFQPILVTNVGQVATLYVTGNAQLAFLAEAQVPFIGRAEVTRLDGLYSPIQQDAAFLARAGDNPAAVAFWAFLTSDVAAQLIVANGYDLAQ